MLIRVVDNNTNKVLAQAKTNDWAKTFITYIDGYRRQYTNATIEWYYGNTAEGTPKTFKTFN